MENYSLQGPRNQNEKSKQWPMPATPLERADDTLSSSYFPLVQKHEVYTEQKTKQLYLSTIWVDRRNQSVIVLLFSLPTCSISYAAGSCKYQNLG